MTPVLGGTAVAAAGTRSPLADRWSPDAETRYAPAEPVDLLRTVAPLRRGAGDPTFLREAARPVVWRTVRTPSGPATLRLAQRTDGSIGAHAWGSGAAWAIDGVPELLGHGDDWGDLDLTAVPWLAEVRRRNPGLRLTRCRQVFEMMLAAILEQKVTVLEAHRSWARLVRWYGERAPGPAPEGMRVCPPADAWRRLPSWDWHRAGVDPKRAKAAVEAARVAAGLERTLELGRGGAEVARRLRTVPGVGIWTAAETSQRAHGDADAPSFGDLHVPALVGLALAGHPVDDEGMLELLEPWRGARQRIVRLVMLTGVRRPRIAPKAAIEDHRRR
jgi:3-methyladenine DNA glycosylase/8-oxoguanine DNA glycosylase